VRYRGSSPRRPTSSGNRPAVAQPGHDLVGAVDHVVIDVVGIGTAAAGVLIRGELGLDVALDRNVA
jgi:hypothetical protein